MDRKALLLVEDQTAAAADIARTDSGHTEEEEEHFDTQEDQADTQREPDTTLGLQTLGERIQEEEELAASRPHPESRLRPEEQ